MFHSISMCFILFYFFVNKEDCHLFFSFLKNRDGFCEKSHKKISLFLFF